MINPRTAADIKNDLLRTAKQVVDILLMPDGPQKYQQLNKQLRKMTHLHHEFNNNHWRI
jgi:hypothetical protein